jgi:protein-S-isoprenylcysteine O-methyltransferase Ste14
MIDTKTGKSMINGFVTMGMMVLLLALLLAAFWNWRAASWHELVWLAAFLGMFIIRWPYSVKNRKNTIVSDENDGTEKLLLLGMFATMTFLPLGDLATRGELLAFADYHLPSWATMIGAALVLPFLLLFWRSHADLGGNWSPGLEMHAEHKLITKGVYAHLRHPMYASIWLAAFMQALLIHNWLAGFAVIPAFLAMHVIRIPREEAMMRKQFGAAYEDYMKRSGRIWPKWV